MFTKTFFAAVFAAIAAAQSNSDNPTVAPATNEVVPGCKPYTLKWNPTTAGTVSIEIISGASQGTLVPVGTVATGIANSGTFSWTPAAALGANAVTGYKIIVDATGEFQFSVPFSVSACKPDEVTSTPVATPTPTKEGEGYPTSTPETVYPTTTPEPSSSCTTTSTVYVNPPAGTGYPHVPVVPGPNTNAPYPVNPPTTMYPTATGTGGVGYPTATPPPPEFTGAASAVKAGLSFAGAAAAFAFML